MICRFVFRDGKLVQGAYMSMAKHITPGLFVEDYKKLKAHLTEKYGNPELDDERWLGEVFKGDPAQYGTAVAIGELQLRSRWKTRRTQVGHALFGRDSMKISHVLIYDDLSTLKMREQEKEEKLRDKL